MIDSEDYAPRDPEIQRQEQIQGDSTPTETRQPTETEVDTTSQNNGSSVLFQENFEDGDIRRNPAWTVRSENGQVRVTTDTVWQGTYCLEIGPDATDNANASAFPTPNVLTADIGRIPTDSYELTAIYRQNDNYRDIASFVGLQNSETSEWIGAGCEADGYSQLRHYDGTGTDPYTLGRSADGHTVDSNYTSQGGSIKNTSRYYNIFVFIDKTDYISEVTFSETDGSRVYKQETFGLRGNSFDRVFLSSVAESGGGSAFFDVIQLR